MTGGKRTGGEPAGGEGPRRRPRFFLARTPDEGTPELEEEERRHALSVLRLAAGDRLEGLDGRGTAWPLVVAAAGRRELSLQGDGEPRREPPPGAPDALLPAVEVAAALPKGSRAEALVAALVALGAAGFTPLRARFSGPEAGPDREGRRRRLERAAREACKQSGRLWLPAWGAALAPEELAAARPGAAVVVCDPRAERSLASWAAEARGREPEQEIVLAVGPEGGFAPEEREALVAGGALPVRLGPYVLRVELAAQAAMAVLAAALARTRV